jgi:TolA-binding protein
MAAMIDSYITETPLGFTSNLLDTLSQARSSLDAFVSHHKSVLDSVSSSGAASIEKYTEELTKLNARLNEVEGQDGDIKRLNNQKMEEVTRKEAEVDELEERVRKEGGDKIESLKAEEETARALAESCR